jgi:hypothetical protein
MDMTTTQAAKTARHISWRIAHLLPHFLQTFGTFFFPVH